MMIAGMLLLAALAAGGQATRQAREDLVAEVRTAIGRNDPGAAERAVHEYRARHGATPELAEAVSWIGRGYLAKNMLDRADASAVEARSLVTSLLHGRALDAEPHLPTAMGAAIEVHAAVLAARGARSEAVDFLRQELAAWGHTSIVERIRKNLNLLDLTGKPAPALTERHWLGPKPQALAALKGHPVLLFFWAHWCIDCKNEAAGLARLLHAYGPKGLAMLAPTRLYGYAARGEPASPEEETRYIDAVREKYYGELRNVAAPLDADNFRVYGASTTPTLVLIDRSGVVRLYHPGAMTEAELDARIRALL